MCVAPDATFALMFWSLTGRTGQQPCQLNKSQLIAITSSPGYQHPHKEGTTSIEPSVKVASKEGPQPLYEGAATIVFVPSVCIRTSESSGHLN